MTVESVGFIGGGNMTRAIVRGMLASHFDASTIRIAEPANSQQEELRNFLPGVDVFADNNTVVADSRCVVLAVKPQILAEVCRELSAAVQATKPLIVSIAAGPRIADIDSWLGGDNAIVRVMPNQPALVGRGISGLFANAKTSATQLQSAENILSSIGPVVTLQKEADIDAVTAVSGSGPAYFYLLIDMLTKAGESLGLESHSAQQLALETAVGATMLAKQSGDDMESLIARVRSPGGTTAAALDALEASGVRDIFAAAITAARDRATQLADLAHDEIQE